MVRPLKSILERQSELLYHMHMQVSDQMEMDVSELDWTHGWLVNQKKKEEKALKGEKVDENG
jgi:hypothetical protein